MSIYITIGTERLEAEPIRGMTGRLLAWRIVLARSADGVFVSADLDACHKHGCPSTVLGKKRGRCNCGATDLLRQVAERALVTFDLRGDRPGFIEVERPSGPRSMRVAPECLPIAKAEGWEAVS